MDLADKPLFPDDEFEEKTSAILSRVKEDIDGMAVDEKYLKVAYFTMLNKSIHEIAEELKMDISDIVNMKETATYRRAEIAVGNQIGRGMINKIRELSAACLDVYENVLLSENSSNKEKLQAADRIMNQAKLMTPVYVDEDKGKSEEEKMLEGLPMEKKNQLAALTEEASKDE